MFEKTKINEKEAGMAHLKNNEVKVIEHLNAELQSYPFLSWGKRDKIISSFNELHFNLSLKSS